jgi:hypothetical protein
VKLKDTKEDRDSRLRVLQIANRKPVLKGVTFPVPLCVAGFFIGIVFIDKELLIFIKNLPIKKLLIWIGLPHRIAG